LLSTLGAQSALAQHANVPFQSGIPVAPTGLANKPLGNGPFDYATAEGQDIRVVVVTKALSFPYSLAFLPDGTMLVAQRNGQLRTIRNGVLDPNPVSGGPMAYSAGESGMPGAVHGYMNVVLHPQFAQNQMLYLSHTKRLDDRNRVAVARAKWTNGGLTSSKTSSSPSPATAARRQSRSAATGCSTSRPAGATLRT
jgi:glucose/arabinose dehydrogenase